MRKPVVPVVNRRTSGWVPTAMALSSPFLRLLLLAVAAQLCRAVGGGSEVQFDFGAERFRVQALSPTLLRLERAGSLGFLDNNTNLAVNRSGFGGVALQVISRTPSQVVLATSDLRVVVNVSGAVPPTAAHRSAGNGTCRHQRADADAGLPERVTDCESSLGNKTVQSCCAACDKCNSCTATVYQPTSGYCWLLANSGPSRPRNDRILCTTQPLPPPDATVTISRRAGGSVLFSGLAPSAVAFTPAIPAPADLMPDDAVRVFAVRDSPRFVRPDWGATPAPVNASLGPLASTSGYDLRFADGADAYFFVIPNAGSGSAASVLVSFPVARQPTERLATSLRRAYGLFDLLLLSASPSSLHDMLTSRWPLLRRSRLDTAVSGKNFSPSLAPFQLCPTLPLVCGLHGTTLTTRAKRQPR